MLTGRSAALDAVRRLEPGSPLGRAGRTRGELAETIEYADRGATLAGELGDTFTACITRVLKGYFEYVLGGRTEGIAAQVDGIERLAHSGSRQALGLHHAQVAECYARAGRLDECERHVEHSIARADAGEAIGLTRDDGQKFGRFLR